MLLLWGAGGSRNSSVRGVRRPRPRVTFVTYEASRTGSPILLLRFLRWLREHADLDVEVVCWRPRPPGEQGLLHDADRYLAAAQAVADNLVVHHGIAAGQVAVIPGFVDDPTTAGRAGAAAGALRERLGIPPTAAVVGAVGDLIWRK